VVVPPSGIRLQLSEVVADNLSGLRDEAGETEDWLELENCGESVVSLDGLGLTKEYFDQDPAWRFPAGVRLAPRERLVAFCDGNPTQGGLHTSFRLDRDGDQVLLVTTAQPAAVLDALSFGPLPGDAAFGRLDCGGDPQVLDRPTPGTANVGPVLFRRGDGNSDGEINLTDAVLTLNYLFLGGEAPACQDAADANDSSNLDLTDAVRLLNFLFLGGQAPAAPFPECGLDRSPDGLAPCEYPPASCAAAG
jgi:hypothetical protein